MRPPRWTKGPSPWTSSGVDPALGGIALPAEEVVVVGGSAAGFLSAALLARAGRPVHVVERTPTLDPSRRTLIVTCRLQDLVGEATSDVVVNRIDRFELFADGVAATVPLSEPDLVIERSALIRTLAKQAEDSGAAIRLGHRFRGLARSPRGVAVSVDRRGEVGATELRAGAVVGADGASSAVARAGGWPPHATVPLLQAIVRTPEDLDPGTSRVWFRPEDTPYFYWLIPESEKRSALGVIGIEGPRTRARLDRFLADHDLEALEYQAARIPAYTAWTPVRRSIGGSDVYLVGDAAGQVKVSTVGGVVTGLRGAKGAVESILGRGEATLRDLRRELDAHRLVRKALHDWSQRDYVRLLRLMGTRATRSIGSATRDEPWVVLRRAVLTEPRLVLLALRGLITGTFRPAG